MALRSAEFRVNDVSAPPLPVKVADWTIAAKAYVPLFWLPALFSVVGAVTPPG